MLTAAEINADHKARFAALVEKHGSAQAIPVKENLALGEQTRLMFVELTARDAEVPPERRKDKTEKLTRFATDNVGARITMPELAEAVGASVGTAYAFFRDNRSLFRSTDERGVYEITDAEAERAADKAAAAAGSAPTRSESDIAASDAQAVLNAMSGGTATRRSGGSSKP